MEAPPPLPKKKDILEALLGESNVFLHLDPRKSGVVVPKWFQNQPELVLQLGLRMAVPIPDLEVDDEGVSCTLSFSRAPFWCCIPWSSIFAVVSEKDRRGVVWPDDVPPDGQSAKSIKPAKPRPKLAAVPSWTEDSDDSTDKPASEDRPVEAEAELPPIGPDTKCGVCGTPWVEDQSSCPVCGTSAVEALRPADAAPKPTSVRPAPALAAVALAAVPPPPSPALAAVDAPGEKVRPTTVKRSVRPKPKSKPSLGEAPPDSTPQAPAETGEASKIPSSEDRALAPQPPKKTAKRELPPYLRVVK